MKPFNSVRYRYTVLWLLAAVGAPQGASAAPPTQVTPLMSKDFPNLPGKEGVVLSVTYPPGGSDPVHRHNAHGFIYVTESSIVMDVRGGSEVTLLPGQVFYEGPGDVHTVGRNASKTRPARFVVFLVKDTGAPVVVPAR